jgi:SAM-dependent methyltransferase
MGQDYFDRYSESVYCRVNALEPQDYERCTAEFASIYKGLLPSDLSASVLDIGCGAGFFLYFLKKNGYAAHYGIDISSQQAGLCRQHVTDNVEVVDAVDFLKDKQGRYALIAAHDVLEHIPKDRALLFIRLCRAALAEGGVLVIRVPNMSNPLAAQSRYIDMTHETGYTSRSLYQLLFCAGFTDIHFKGGLMMLRRGWRASLRRSFIRIYYAWVKFLYFVQDFQVPEYLDHNLIAVIRKTKEQG